MNKFHWYVQRFSDANHWFIGDDYLKNGNMTGITVVEFPGSRARPKAKRMSIPQTPPSQRLWTLMPEVEVPERIRERRDEFKIEKG